MGLSKRQQEIKGMLVASIADMEPVISEEANSLFFSVYLGSYMSLDPCGRYHHILSPNGVTKNCAQFWDSLEKIADLLGGWIEGGEGDPTDIYFCMSVDSYDRFKNKKKRKENIKR